MARTAVAALAALVILGGCGTAAAPSTSPGPTTASPSSPTTPTATPSPKALAWSPCPKLNDWDEVEGWQCATLQVPLDYARPDGPTIGLEIGRHPATDPSQRIGALVWLQSQPPATSIGAAQVFSETILRQFDLVGFEPRGVARSQAIHCLATRPTLDQPYPRDAAQLAAFVAASKSVAEACANNSGATLPYLGLEAVARDLEQLRLALGEERLSLAGNNWAATLDARYADLYPTHVRAAVLGGPVLPGIDDEAVGTVAARALQRNLDSFLADCAKDTACAFHSAGAPRQALDALLARLRAGRVDGLSERDAVVAMWLGLMSSREDLAKGLAAAVKGDTSALRQMVEWSGVNDAVSSDAYDGYNCIDYAWARTPEAYTAMADRVADISPDFGRWLVYGDLGCAFWPAPARPTPTTLRASGAPPILVVAARDDRQFPYAWSVDLSRQLRSAVLLTVESDAISTIYADSECARAAVDHYLLTAEPPAAGTTCR